MPRWLPAVAVPLVLAVPAPALAGVLERYVPVVVHAGGEWPDPNDEADGRGERVRPRLVRIGEDRPAWMCYRGPLGRLARELGARRDELATRPCVPAPGRWSDPDAWAAAARPCTREDCDRRGECDGRETAMAAVLAALGLLAAVLSGARRTRRFGAGAGERRTLEGSPVRAAGRESASTPVARHFHRGVQR
jgi:hypothetical protein